MMSYCLRNKFRTPRRRLSTKTHVLIAAKAIQRSKNRNDDDVLALLLVRTSKNAMARANAPSNNFEPV